MLAVREAEVFREYNQDFSQKQSHDQNPETAGKVNLTLYEQVGRHASFGFIYFCFLSTAGHLFVAPIHKVKTEFMSLCQFAFDQKVTTFTLLDFCETANS